MSRTIRTIDGEEHSGLKSSFSDEGDHIVKSGWGSRTTSPSKTSPPIRLEAGSWKLAQER